MAGSREDNRGRQETRVLQSTPITAEQAGFALAAQAACLHRKVTGRSLEVVILLTSLPPERLGATRWLELNRHHWGIENGLHARLDVSRRDDQSRLHATNAVHVHGIFARLANSLFIHWRNLQPKPQHKTTSHFVAAMSADHACRALSVATSRNPSFAPAS